MNKEKLMPIIDLTDIDGEIIIGKFDIRTDENGKIVVTPTVVDTIPEITVQSKNGNTAYYVTGSYVGKTDLSSKISQILKRNMEAEGNDRGI